MPRIGRSKASFGGQLSSGMGCVISYCPIASAIGNRVLQDGGNAVDAAVATGIALAVTYPQAGNLGGGGFMLAQLQDGNTKFLDYRECAPANINPADYLEKDGTLSNRSVLGGAAVAVPGTIAGFSKALSELGTWGWDRVVSLSIDLAERGTWLTNRQTAYLKAYNDDFSHFEESLCVFTDCEGSSYKPGNIFTQPDLGRTLRVLAEDGPDSFYKGKISKKIIETTSRYGGSINEDDLANYDAKWREPLRRQAFGREIITASMPSGGGVILCIALGLLEACGVNETQPGSADRYELLSRVFRLAFAIRADLVGDPDFVGEATAKRLIELTSRNFDHNSLNRLEQQLALDTQASNQGSIPDKNTTHFCVFDGAGNVVSNTYSLNTLFGSKLVAKDTGVILNNTIDDFCVAPGQPNWYALIDSEQNKLAPYRRPVGSMTPTVVLNNGVVELALGASGGPRIPTLITQVILGMYGDGLPLARAVQAPRVHHQYLPDVLHTEMSISEDTLKSLEKRNIKINVVPRLGIGAGAHRIDRDNLMHAQLDPRF